MKREYHTAIKPKLIKDISGYDGLYAITSDYQIWSYPKKTGINRKGIILTPVIAPNGYYKLRLYKDGRVYPHSVHRLIALNLITNPKNYPEINHKDGDKLNNNPSNLEWVTHKQNKEHAVANGLTAKGEKQGIAKLTEKAVREIRLLYRPGVVGYAFISKHYDVTSQTIHFIIKRKNWRHVK